MIVKQVDGRTMTKRRAVTSAEIAQEAGVSRATVSAVLNEATGNIRISPETRRRVLAVASKFHYVPNPAARALRSNRSGAIAFVSRTMHQTAFGHPVSYQLNLHSAQAAARVGAHVIEISPETTGAVPGEVSGDIFGFLLSRRPDGVIFDAPTRPDDVAKVLESGIPVVQLLRPHLGVPTATVTVDATRGVHEAIDHLVGLGHRAILYLGSADTHRANRSRLDAFHAALQRHGIVLPESAVALGPDYTLEGSIALARAALRREPSPTAIFAGGDIFAVGALHALHELRVRVPDAISLVSYDDVYAPLLYPPITSVAQPLRDVAQRAIDVLMRQIEHTAGETDGDADAPPAHLVLPTQLHIRSSTQPPRPSGPWTG